MIQTIGEYEERLEHVPTAVIGEMWDECFDWKTDPYPAGNRWDMIAMLYAKKYPNNPDRFEKLPEAYRWEENHGEEQNQPNS